MDCTKVCNRNAIGYRPNKGKARKTASEPAQAG
jgi:hypothetical protein